MIQKIVLASKNKGKYKEIKYILDPLSIEVLTLDDLKIDLPDSVEIHSDYYENAKEKCLFVANYTDLPILADDSGLEIDSLGGKPGILSARYAGTGIDSDNRQKVLHEMIEIQDPERSAKFICVICLLYIKEFYYFEGISFGKILFQEIGENGFGYDSIFYSKELQKSYGLLNFEEKMKISHRGIALRKLAEYLKMAK